MQNLLGNKGTRCVREILGRSARHRVQVQCRQEITGGGSDTWVICPDVLVPGGIIYSLGVGNIIKFDLAMIEKYQVNVFAFDPTPGSVAWIKKQNLPEHFHFIEYGIMDFDGMAKFRFFGNVQYGPYSGSEQGDFIELNVCRLKTMMEKLNHKKIHLLKMNIEGGEYAVIKDLVASNLDIEQIIVEFHHRLPGHSLRETYHAINLLNEQGYRIFNISDNGKEYSFIKVGMNVGGF
jgi:FkbM family methyltransferase